MTTLIEPKPTGRRGGFAPPLALETAHTPWISRQSIARCFGPVALEAYRKPANLRTSGTEGLVNYVGPYAGLSLSQQHAVTELTVRRYIDEIYHLDAYLQEAEGLTPGSPEFQRARRARHGDIWKALSGYDDQTYISALLFSHGSDAWTAVAAMRMIRGRNTTLPISQTIGRVDSSIPTHRLLRSFRYPQFPGFTPDTIDESNLFEVSRLVCADETVHERLVNSKEMSQTEFRAVQVGAFDELMASATRYVRALSSTASWIFNVKPRLAAALRIREGFNLVPLFTDGVEPTQFALSSSLDRPYFHRWTQELLNVAPPEVASQGIAATVRHLAGCGMRVWQDCAATLPYLVLSDTAIESAIQKIEARLSNRSYNLSHRLSHA